MGSFKPHLWGCQLPLPVTPDLLLFEICRGDSQKSKTLLSMRRLTSIWSGSCPSEEDLLSLACCLPSASTRSASARSAAGLAMPWPVSVTSTSTDEVPRVCCSTAIAEPRRSFQIQISGLSGNKEEAVSCSFSIPPLKPATPPWLQPPADVWNLRVQPQQTTLHLSLTSPDRTRDSTQEETILEDPLSLSYSQKRKKISATCEIQSYFHSQPPSLPWVTGHCSCCTLSGHPILASVAWHTDTGLGVSKGAQPVLLSTMLSQHLHSAKTPVLKVQLSLRKPPSSPCGGPGPGVVDVGEPVYCSSYPARPGTALPLPLLPATCLCTRATACAQRTHMPMCTEH